VPWTSATNVVINSDAFIGADYPVIEVRMKRIWGGGSGPGWDPTAPLDSAAGGPKIDFFIRNDDGDTVSFTGGSMVSSVDGAIHPNPQSWRSVFPVENLWTTLEFDMDIPISPFNDPWSDLDIGYKIITFRLWMYAGAAAPASPNDTWNPQTNPMWEIDYIRVKKRGTPINLGPTASRVAEMLFDSDLSHMGLVHQTGTVTIGTAKALIDGNTSNRVVGHNIDVDNVTDGYISFPELPYIPLVLFQRIDENLTITGSSYPGGEEEFSICTQNWEDNRYPTFDTNTSEVSHKGFDIQTVPEVNFSSYSGTPVMSENFKSFSSTTVAGLGDYSGAFELPWTGDIPSISNRSGNSFVDMAQSFSEVRTFAYARAKKDGFWLTCRNAIAQEGLEPVLNLAPVNPQDGIQDHGNSSFTSMFSNNDNGAWGMFHPALALYDGEGFAEGIQLNWDSKVTANSILLDKISTDAHSQYRWNPSFSCSGLPFNGALARPNGPAPTDKSVYTTSYGASGAYTSDGILANTTGGFYPYRFQCNDWSHEGPAVGTLATGVQYNIKRLSSQGIFHPHGIVPETSLAFDNKNTDFVDVKPGMTSNMFNQTAYIGGGANKRISGIHVHTLDIRTDEKWPNEPQKSYFDFGGNTQSALPPFFCLSPPGVSPESILYTTGYDLPPTGYHYNLLPKIIKTDLDAGGELMIANIDGTNPRIFHDNSWELGSSPPSATTANYYSLFNYAMGKTQASSPNPGSGAVSQHRHIHWAPDGKSILYDTSSSALIDAYTRNYEDTRGGNIQAIAIVDVSYRDVPGDEIYIESRQGGPHTWKRSIRNSTALISSEANGEAPRVNPDGLAHLIYVSGIGIIGGSYFTGQPGITSTHMHGSRGTPHDSTEGPLANRMADGIAYLWSGLGHGNNGNPAIVNLSGLITSGLHPYNSPDGGGATSFVRAGLRLGYPIHHAYLSWNSPAAAVFLGFYVQNPGIRDIWDDLNAPGAPTFTNSPHFTAPYAWSIFAASYNESTGDGFSPNARDSQGVDLQAMDSRGSVPVFVPGTNGEWITWNGWAYNIGPEPLEANGWHPAGIWSWSAYDSDWSNSQMHPHLKQGPDPRGERVDVGGGLEWRGHFSCPKGDGWMGMHANSLFAATSLDPVTQQIGAEIGNIAFSWDGTKAAWTNGTDILIGDFPGMDAIVSENQSAPPREGTVGITNVRALTQNEFGSPSFSPLFNADDTKVFFITSKASPGPTEPKYDIQYSDVYPEQVTYDPDLAHPPTYKYWVLRVPVSFPEYT
jgi:hypothetical protein